MKIKKLSKMQILHFCADDAEINPSSTDFMGSTLITGPLLFTNDFLGALLVDAIFCSVERRGFVGFGCGGCVDELLCLHRQQRKNLIMIFI